MGLNRRTFMATAGSAAALLATPYLAVRAATPPRVVVVGGGAGGATVARYLGMNGKDALHVTLVEPSRTYFTCFFSNLFLGGFRSYASLGSDYRKLATAFDVNVVHDWAVRIDRDKRAVILASGERLSYDALVLSPGIDFVEGSVPGWSLSDQGRMPHAYRGGTQAHLLDAQIASLPAGGVFALVAPPNPYRCPPGPYERVSLVAHRLKSANPTAKILVVDPKESFSKMALFQEAWADHYDGMIDRIGPEFGGDNVSVNPTAGELTIDGEVTQVDVCNVIPAMRAGQICFDAGLTEGNWVPVEPTALTSTNDPNIHVLGDSAQQGDMPKSGFSANSQAKVVANAIRARLTGSRRFPVRYTNTCWSMLSPENSVKVGASYEPGENKITSVSKFISETGESFELRKQTYLESESWYQSVVADIFG